MQVSRLRRLGLLSSGSGIGGDTHGEGEENSAPVTVVDITFASLVVRRVRVSGEDSKEQEEEEAQTAVKNFKKFRKVHCGLNKCTISVNEIYSLLHLSGPTQSLGVGVTCMGIDCSGNGTNLVGLTWEGE